LQIVGKRMSNLFRPICSFKVKRKLMVLSGIILGNVIGLVVFAEELALCQGRGKWLI